MIEIYLLEQLDAFARLGTLSAASEELHISQPALTRSMKKIESEFGVSLFERQKNRMFLNENGKLAAEHAARILEANRDMERIVRAFDRSHRTISLGCCAPSPAYLLTPHLQQMYPDMTISADIRAEDVLIQGLQNDTYQLIVLHEKPEDASLVLQECGHESLAVSVPPAHPLAAFDRISFTDLDGIPMLQYSKVGFWYELTLRKIPHPHLLLQESRDTFTEIANASALPTFFSISFDRFEHRDNGNRKIISLSDPEASVTYYLICKKHEYRRFRSFFSHLTEWTQD
jgi:DNA-binding transcriptional LysR family regulator